jgi:hypothetical protein
MPDQRTATTIWGLLLAPYRLIRLSTAGSASSRKRKLDPTRHRELLDAVRNHGR